MAHHLIALFLSSARDTTSPCIIPIHPIYHHSHTAEILFSHISLCFMHCFRLSVQLSFSSPHPFSSIQLFIPPLLYLHPRLWAWLSVSLLLLLWFPSPPRILSLACSVFSADVPLVSSGLAGRQQKWLWDWGMAALLSVTQSYSDEPSAAKGRQREENIKQEDKRKKILWIAIIY